MSESKQIKPPQSRFGNLIVISIILLFVFAIVFMFTGKDEKPVEYNYSSFMEKLDAGEIVTITSSPISG
jgi:hypothetical protein